MKDNNNILDFEIIDVSSNKKNYNFSDIEMIDVSTINSHTTKRKKSILYSCILLLSVFLFVLNIYVVYVVKINNSIRLNQIIYNDAFKTCSALFENNMVKDNIYNIDIDRCLYKIDLVENKKVLKIFKKKF